MSIRPYCVHKRTEDEQQEQEIENDDIETIPKSELNSRYSTIHALHSELEAKNEYSAPIP